MRELSSTADDGSSKHAKRVLLVGERFLLLDALRVALATEQIDVAATGTRVGGIEEALSAFHPHVVVVDGFHSADETVARTIRLLKEHGRTVVGIAPQSVSVEAAQLVGAGADWVLGHDTGFELLAAAITQCLAGERAMPLDRRYTLENLLREYRAAEDRRWLLFEELTKRERVIFSLVYEGLSADQIAEDACVSISTVRSHIRHILIKLNVNSQLAAVAIARSNAWFDARSSMSGAA